MSSFHRQNLYSGASEDLGTDFSGFLGDMPQVDPSDINSQAHEQSRAAEGGPKVTQRARGTKPSNSNASGTVGYVMPNPLMNNEPDSPPIYYSLSPFWADDDSIAPKAAAVSKTVGAVGMVLSGTYAAAKRSDGGSPAAKAAFFGSSALYVHPVLGINHGLLKIVPGKEHWIAKYPRYGGIGLVHAIGAYGFYKLVRRQFY
tara:strand:+ start:7404 stop:8006 length:603 start_codon:yes stop_codon:yes gene_type:complete